MMRQNDGFSLIEMMIVVSIMGVLATFALPAYQDFIHKAEFTEMKMAVGPVKVGVEICTQTLGLANSSNCKNNTNGIPKDIEAKDDVVGMTLTGTALEKQGEAVKDDEFVITATAPNNSRNPSDQYKLTGTLQDDGSIVWDNGVCSESRLC